MDAACFKKQFIPCYPKLYRVAHRLLGNVQEAEDVVQEAYLKLWERRDVQTTMLNTEAYCVALVKNLCWDKLRNMHNNMDDRSPEELNLQADVGTNVQVEQRDEVAYIKKLIEQLPESQRQVITLRDLNECSFEEIEKATGLTAINIRVLLSRARKKIREQFKEVISYEYR